jgi:glutamate/tyrosine decarboxylase-like PLP-dependent enzyme
MAVPTSPVTAVEPWGDESSIVLAVLAWAQQRVVRHSDPKATARPASELAAAAGPAVTPEGIGAFRALQIFDEVLVPATRAQDDPMNLAYVPAAPTRAAIAFDLATSAANILGALWEAGAGAIHAENEALQWLVDLLGWPAGSGGCFVSGGTSGNLAALVAAREAATVHHGRPPGRWVLATSDEAHSSVRSAARVMDVDVVAVPGDDRGRILGPALAAALDSVGPGDRVFAVAASAGTTNSGIVDDLVGIADVCAGRGLWLHVDGAYGGAALAAPSVRHLFDGIDRADSFIVDPHKWLFAPYDACAVLYRRPEYARAAHTQTASYLDTIDREAWNPADYAVHLSRRARGLPFWFSLACHGTRAYAEAVERTLVVAHEVAAHIRDADHLDLVMEPDLSVLLFERPGWDRARYEAWSHELALAGRILCLPTTWRGRSLLRLAFVNPATEPSRVVEELETLR